MINLEELENCTLAELQKIKEETDKRIDATLDWYANEINLILAELIAIPDLHLMVDESCDDVLLYPDSKVRFEYGR